MIVEGKYRATRVVALKSGGSFSVIGVEEAGQDGFPVIINIQATNERAREIVNGAIDGDMVRVQVRVDAYLAKDGKTVRTTVNAI